jgi:hypothetical protein
LTDVWKDCFASLDEVLAYIVPQDRALSSQAWYRQVTLQEIQLGIPLSSIRPLSGEVHSGAAERIVGGAQPLCWYVPEVTFRFDREIRFRSPMAMIKG